MGVLTFATYITSFALRKPTLLVYKNLSVVQRDQAESLSRTLVIQIAAAYWLITYRRCCNLSWLYEIYSGE